MKHLIALIAVLIAASSTSAQEANWDGWFLGVDAGYIGRQSTSAADGTLQFAGPMAGIVAGHWWQMNPVTLGFDVGASLGGAQIDYRQPTFAGGSWRSVGGETVTLTARAKIGAPIGDTLVYAAGGLQYLHNYYTSTYTSPWGLPSTSSAWSTQSGFSMAIGAEHRFTPSMSIKGEASYNAIWPTQTTTYSGWSSKLGFNYYFN